jgi:hypothetical protein
MKSREKRWGRNCRLARSTWGKLGREAMDQLKFLTTRYCLSVAEGDLQLLNGRWYVTHAGLLSIAHRKGCSAIKTTVVNSLCAPSAQRWVFRAVVYKAEQPRGFVGYGDADPSNTSPLVRGAEMRVAETRAVNRALRKAYGIGLCSVEELGWSSNPTEPSQPNQAKPFNTNGKGHSQPLLRDQLCLLIRQYNLDPTLVKAYAAHFCGTATLKEASRELVESFISHLADSAKEDRSGLVCKLNSYAQPTEVPQ